mmetsp:Transcript_3996/g.12519  ORF Transcript_3996/g.12519 Transcript_3996/m.12519 type:complete len:218 (-) Transcript_3996:108-761(-)
MARRARCGARRRRRRLRRGRVVRPFVQDGAASPDGLQRRPRLGWRVGLAPLLGGRQPHSQGVPQEEGNARHLAGRPRDRQGAGHRRNLQGRPYGRHHRDRPLLPIPTRVRGDGYGLVQARNQRVGGVGRVYGRRDGQGAKVRRWRHHRRVVSALRVVSARWSLQRGRVAARGLLCSSPPRRAARDCCAKRADGARHEERGGARQESGPSDVSRIYRA